MRKTGGTEVPRRLNPPQPNTRREFLAAALAGQAGLSARASYAPSLVLQPYVWTQQFQKEKISLAEGMEKLFAGSQRAGYTRIELMNSFLTPELRDRTAALVRQYDFQVPIVYSGAALHEQSAAERSLGEILELVDVARPLGCRAVTVNPNPKPKREPKSDEELATQARYLDRLGRHLAQRSLRLMIHNHDPEMADNAREWRSNLQHTDPKLVWFCVDVHWIYRGKQDPMTLVREAGPRISSLHLRNSTQGVWSESFGDGDIDYREVARFLKKLRYQGFLEVELAYEKDTRITRPLEDDLRLSRIYAGKIFDVRA